MDIVKPNNLLNKGITASEVRLVVDGGEQLLLSREEALQRAQEAGLDLFLVSPTSEPPVAKILDYGHYRYEQEKKYKEARKKGAQKQKSNIVKEVKLTPRIGDHDFNVRLKRSREFLGKGYKVKLTVFFKGREATHPELGHQMIARYLEAIADLGWTDATDLRPRLQGRMMTMMIAPGRKRNDDAGANVDVEEVISESVPVED